MRAIDPDRGIFTLSLDFELIWGALDLCGPDPFREACAVERGEVIDQLLELLEELEVSATWCTLGHLFLDHCSPEGGRKHPEIVPPRHAWHPAEWFQHDPCSNEADAPGFYGRSLLEKIRACAVPQEIGCHSFSHVIFGDPGCSRETAQSEVAACVRLAEQMGLKLRSFAFPRNVAGHLDVLREAGFRCYRGPEPVWYEEGQGRSVFKRLAHLWDVLIAAAPPVVSPEWVSPGLWNIPGSMIYFPMHGFRRYIPVSLRVARAVKGLDAAAARKQIFHLWFHPTNLAFEPEQMLGGLRRILHHAASLRARGALAILPMGSIVPAAPGEDSKEEESAARPTALEETRA
jgi:peptidoglycan/xylan/chitin deacetylase (PgdA/CDA1 family)